MYDLMHVENYSFDSLGKHYSSFGGFTFSNISTVAHYHLDFYEFIFITYGELTHIHNNTATPIPAGTLLLLKPGTTHQLFTEKNNGVHFVLCVEKHFFEKRSAELFPDFNLGSFEHFLSKSINKNKASYIEQIATVLSKDHKSNIALADEILYLCLSDFATLNITRDCEYYIDDIIRKFKQFQYMNVSAKDIYAQYPYSESVLLREFKKRTGMSIAEYRTRQKMKYACQLLAETDARIIGIALTLDYTSLSYFVRAFRKIYGMNPTEYRKLHKKK